jgi:hypothetical protein
MCLAGYLALLVLALTSDPKWLLLVLFVLLAATGLLFLRAKPRPREQRWSELLKAFAPLVVLWFAFQLTPPIARAFAILASSP